MTPTQGKDASMSIKLNPSSPTRPVDWRWQRAEQLTKLGKRPSKYHDEWTRHAVRFQKAILVRATPARLARREPALWAAHQIYGAADSGVRHELEARLLARDSIENIARRCAMTVEAIEAYERVFFNVQERLDSTGYIMHVAIGPAVHGELTEQHTAILWKLYGYHCGPRVLDQLIDGFIPGAHSAAVDDTDHSFGEDAHSNLAMRLAILARTVPVNDSTRSTLLKVYARFRELEQQTAAESYDKIGLGTQVIGDLSSEQQFVVQRSHSAVDQLMHQLSGCGSTDAHSGGPDTLFEPAEQLNNGQSTHSKEPAPTDDADELVERVILTFPGPEILGRLASMRRGA